MIKNRKIEKSEIENRKSEKIGKSEKIAKSGKIGKSNNFKIWSKPWG